MMSCNKHALVGIICSLFLASCGGGSSNPKTPVANDPGSNDSVLVGVFVDSPVGGISFNTESRSGVTNAAGEFSYLAGEQVTFAIGLAKLPSVVAAPRVSPVDMAASSNNPADTTTNIARLLQSLDQDGNPDNGITIPQNATASATQLNFDVEIDEFEKDTDVINLVANSGSVNTTLISSVAAIKHLSATLDNTSDSQQESVFTPWLNASDYQAKFDEQVGLDRYPIIVEGRCVNNTPQYRATFVAYPPQKFRFWSHHNLDDKGYNELKSRLQSEGYRAISEQNFVCDGVKIYQGTWVLN